MTGEAPDHPRPASDEVRPDMPNNTLWILTEVYYPEEISTGYYLTSIAEGIARDRTVKVITGQPKHMSRGRRAAKRETHNDVEIFREWGTTFDKNVFVGRLVNVHDRAVRVFSVASVIPKR
jgi:colanic acid biosynthesis glycosyl transferase WcaI